MPDANKNPNASSAGGSPATTPTSNTAPAKKIEIDESILLGLQKTIEDLKKNQDKLMAVADKNRLALYDQRSQTEIIKTAKMSFLDGKPIVAWKTIKDEVYISQGVYHETQIVELTFDDGTTTQMSLIDSARKMQKQPGEIVSRTRDNEGNEIVRLLLRDGREFNLDIKFLN